MPKYTVETDDLQEHEQFLAAPALVGFIWRWEQEVLRQNRKYGDGKPIAWDEVERVWHAMKDEIGLSADIWQ